MALDVAAALDVGVGELVDDGELRLAPEQRVEVHLGEDAAAIHQAPPRQDLEAAQQGLGLGAPVGLDDADHHVDAFPAPLLRRLEHGVGLADARVGAEEDLEPAAPFLLGLLEQRFGCRPALVFSHPRPSPRPAWSLTILSRARLRSSTLTRGSPSRPNVRPSVCSSTERAHAILRQAACLGHTGDLEQGGLRRDVRVEPAAGCGDQIDRAPRHRFPAQGAQRCRPLAHARRPAPGWSGARLEPPELSRRSRRPRQTVAVEVARRWRTPGRSERSR